MLLRALIRHSPLLVLLFGATTLISAGGPGKPRPVEEPFGPIDSALARAYSDIVLNYKSYAPWATTAAYVNPPIRLARGQGARGKGAGERFAEVALAESIARHDWRQRQLQADQAVRIASLPAAPLPGPGRMSDLGGEQQLRRSAAPPPRWQATSGTAAAPTSTTTTSTAPQAPEITLPEGVTIVSPVEAITNAVKSLNEVDAALKQAIAAGG